LSKLQFELSLVAAGHRAPVSVRHTEEQSRPSRARQANIGGFRKGERKSIVIKLIQELQVETSPSESEQAPSEEPQE